MFRGARVKIRDVVAVAALGLFSVGCAAPEAREVVITYELDRFATAYPIVDGVPYPITDEDRDRQVQLIVNAYCPANQAQ